ncbi:glycerophosphodiester phosphodiesterase [Microlunatus soli]|nr:glycerophosphodiester phosphodiesterase family protein [Microlunatus soli]
MAEAPENTVASFRRAEEIGIDEVETDVRISADGQLLMLHDATLDRVAADDAGKGLGPIAELPWSVINSVDIGDGERVPTLLQMYESTASTIQLEIKAPAVIDSLVDFFADHRDHAERTFLTGFSIEAISTVAERMPQIRRGIITSTWSEVADRPDGPEGLIKETGSTRLHSGWDGLTAGAVDQLHEAGYQIHGWPTRTREDLRRCLELGLDGTTSDDPRTLKQWLAELVD